MAHTRCLLHSVLMCVLSGKFFFGSLAPQPCLIMRCVHYGSRRTIPDPCTPDLIGLGGRSDPCIPLGRLPMRTCGFDQPLVHHVGRQDVERVRYDVQHLHHDVRQVQHDVHHTHHDVQHLEHNVSHFHHDGGRVVQEPCLTRDLDYDRPFTYCHRPCSPCRPCTAVQIDADPWYYRRLQDLRSSVGRIGVFSEWPSHFGRTPCDLG